MKATREVREGLLLVFPLKKEKKKGSDDSEMSPFVLSRKKRKKKKKEKNQSCDYKRLSLCEMSSVFFFPPFFCFESLPKLIRFVLSEREKRGRKCCRHLISRGVFFLRNKSTVPDSRNMKTSENFLAKPSGENRS